VPSCAAAQGHSYWPPQVRLLPRSSTDWMRSSLSDHFASETEQDDLSPLELHRLTLFKWRYMLESLGFRGWQVHELMFLTWLQATARVHG